MAKGREIEVNIEPGVTLWEYDGPNGPVQVRRYNKDAPAGKHPGAVVQDDVDKLEELGHNRPIRTTERAKELAILSQQQRTDLAWDALVEKMKERHGEKFEIPEGTPYEIAYKFLVAAQAEISDSPELGMAAVKAFPNVERALGIQNVQPKNVNALQINITVSDKAVENYDERAKTLDGMWEEINAGEAG